jgi:hypothetical protein
MITFALLLRRPDDPEGASALAALTFHGNGLVELVSADGRTRGPFDRQVAADLAATWAALTQAAPLRYALDTNVYLEDGR